MASATGDDKCRDALASVLKTLEAQELELERSLDLNRKAQRRIVNQLKAPSRSSEAVAA